MTAKSIPWWVLALVATGCSSQSEQLSDHPATEQCVAMGGVCSDRCAPGLSLPAPCAFGGTATACCVANAPVAGDAAMDVAGDGDAGPPDATPTDSSRTEGGRAGDAGDADERAGEGG
jgi:hypothetical protein